MAAPPFPAVWSALRGDALAAQVLPRYCLDATPTCELVRAGINDTYRVRAGAETYYLRVYVHAWRELHDIEAEVELLNHLRAQELPISYPLATRDGAYIVTLDASEGVRYAVLFSAARGKVKEETDRRSYIYGRLLGQVHVCADRMPGMSKRLHLDHECLLDAPLRAIEPFLEHRRKDYDYLVGIAQQLKARVDELLPKELPEYGICHGDTYMGNIHFADDDTPTLFDFDLYGYGWRAFDVAVLGAILGNGEWSRKAKANRTRRWSLAIKGYEESRALTDAEHEALKVFLPVLAIQTMGLFTAGAPRWGGKWYDDSYFDREIAWVRNAIDYYRIL